MFKEININLYTLALVTILSIILFLELRVTLNTPIVFGDEGFHVRFAQWLAENKEYPKWLPMMESNLYKVAFERPPLWNLLLAGLFIVFGFHEAIPQILTPLIAVFGTGIITFFLAKKVFNERTALFEAIILVTIPCFVTYSVLMYAEALVVFALAGFILSFMVYQKNDEKKYLILSAIFGVIAFLTKRTGLVILPTFGLFIFYDIFKERKIEIKKYIPFILILLIGIFPYLLRNIYVYGSAMAGGLPFADFNDFRYIENYTVQTENDFVGRTERIGTEGTVLNMGIKGYLQFAFGKIYFIPLLFLCGLSYLLYNKDDKRYVILLIFLFSFIPFFIFRSHDRAEDIARYLLGMIIPMSLIIGIYLDKICEFLESHYSRLPIYVFIFIFVLSFFTLNEKLEVMKTVKQFSPSFFEACEWIKENTPENATLYTVWANRAIYSAQRNCIPYAAIPDSRDILLSNNATLSHERMKIEGIDYIFVQKFSIKTEPYRESFPTNFVIMLESNPNKFKKVYENGQVSYQCLYGGCDGNIIYKVM